MAHHHRTAESDCLDAGDPFVTELVRFDDALDAIWQNDMRLFKRVEQDRDAFEIVTLAHWWGLRAPEDGIA